MYTEPTDLDRTELADVIRDGWALDVADLTYEPVGYGTHHYRSGDLFINVDDATDWVTLGRSLAVAVLLKDHKHEYAHAPCRRPDGGWLAGMAEGRYAVSVYDVIDGTSGHFGETLDRDQRATVLAALARLHSETVPPDLPPREDFAIPDRDTVLDDLDVPWTRGPYGERARELIVANAGDLRERLSGYDALVARTPTDGWVVTHGEPHAGNLMWTRAGDLRLIDWDTVKLAPPERDLWLLPGDDWSAYGRGPDEAALRLYRSRWELADICGYVAQLKGAHADDEDTRVAWRALSGYVSS
ncbi:hypothetical protein GCM10009682_52450 [Luedemannella flava]|uniref:Aminoglycoside phosphotransferase domain-containing protein n=1 Tax=Luedemannella flava TaxID=349316 RepID=A0ABP4YP87_9ACTN